MKKSFMYFEQLYYKICSGNTFRIIKLANLLLLVTVFNVFGSKTYLEFASLNLNIKNVPMFNKEIETPVFLQQNRVTGTVTDENSNPLPGVTITIKGTTLGTLSDATGRYVLEKAPQNATLVFSFIGMTTQEIPLEGRNLIDVVLKVEAIGLKEVVVTALGIEKDRAKVGYSTQKVDGQDMVKAREPNAINSLVGKVAGLTVGASNELLGVPSVTLRGRGDILYVVDGVPIQSDTWNISPDDIESYNVLKGPAAAALYGSRGLNGAIIISTKHGTKDKRGFSIEFNSSTTMEKGFLTLPKVQNEYGPGEFGDYAYKNGKNGFNDADYDMWGPRFDGQLIPQYDGEFTPNQTYTTTYPDGNTWTGNIKPTPWIARGINNLQRFLQPGLLSTNNIAVSASGEKYDLRFSYTHTYQGGQEPNTWLNSDNFNVTTGYNFSKKIRFESNINYNRQYTPNFPDITYGPNSIIYDMIVWGAADWNVKDMHNYWEPGKEGIQQLYEEHTRYNNPYFMANEWLRGHYKTDIYGYMLLKYKINDNLNFMGRTQITTYDVLRTEKVPYSGTAYGIMQAEGNYSEDHRNLFENNTDVLLTYNKDFSTPGIIVNLSAGGNIRTFSYKSAYTTTDYLVVPASSLNPSGYSFTNSLNPLKAYNYDAPMEVYSGYWFADASFRKWLNLSVTGRWDQNSTLPPKNNLFFYPSASLSLILSEALKLPETISLLKVRGSYAKVGGAFTSSVIGPIPSVSQGAGATQYGATYYTPYGGPSYGNGAVYSTPLVYNNQPGAYFTTTLNNQDLKPSFNTDYEIGAEVKFFKNRLGLDVTYFSTIEGPQIFSQPLTQATGYSSMLVNGGKDLRTGVEITLNATPILNTNGLNWSVLLNWSTFKTILKELPSGETRLGFINLGDRIDRIYAGGFYRTKDGQLINDSNGIPIYNPVEQYLGNSNSDWNWSMVNKLNYKNWSLAFQVDGVVGGFIYDWIRQVTMSSGRNIETIQGAEGIARAQDVLGIKSYVGPGVVVSNGVQIEYDPLTGAITNYDALQFAPNTTLTFLQSYNSKRYGGYPYESSMISRTFTKLREVTLTYNLPQSILGKMFIRNVTVSFVGRNLLYFAKNKDFDLDQFSTGGAVPVMQTPSTRWYGININLTF